MLGAKILNSSATLNTFEVLGSIDFVAGSEIAFNIRLFQAERADQLRYVADAGATLEFLLPKKDGTDLTVSMTALSDDRSIWQATIDETDSPDLAGGNISFTLVEGGKTSKGTIQNAMSLVITGAC